MNTCTFSGERHVNMHTLKNSTGLTRFFPPNPEAPPPPPKLRNNYARKLEVGISQGQPVLIENVPEAGSTFVQALDA